MEREKCKGKGVNRRERGSRWVVVPNGHLFRRRQQRRVSAGLDVRTNRHSLTSHALERAHSQSLTFTPTSWLTNCPSFRRARAFSAHARTRRPLPVAASDFHQPSSAPASAIFALQAKKGRDRR